MTVEAQDPTSMGNSTSTTTTTVMTTSITVVMTMTSTRTTRVDTRATTVVMEVEVEVEVSLSRRTLVRLNASSARRWGIMLMNACNIPKIMISKIAYHSCIHIELRSI